MCVKINLFILVSIILYDNSCCGNESFFLFRIILFLIKQYYTITYIHGTKSVMFVKNETVCSC